jgi:hypothetical protein
LWVDSAPFGGQQAFAKGEGLHREADVDGELEQRALAVGADVCDGLASSRNSGSTVAKASSSTPTMIVSVSVAA